MSSPRLRFRLRIEDLFREGAFPEEGMGTKRMAKILVIEDEVGLLEEVVEWLQFEDYEVYGATGGAEGIRLAQKHLPDLIVSDVMMPGVDGFRVLAELRTQPATALTPFIFLSALAERHDIRRGMNLGADDYVTKPFTREELLGAIRTRLTKDAAGKRRAASALEELRLGVSTALPHELRTPLVGIIGFGELMAMDPGSFTGDEIAHMANSIVASGERLMHLIDNYLLYVQLELAQEAAPSPDDLSCAGEVVERAGRQVSRQQDREGDLRLELADTVVPIAEDGLEKVVRELVDNAFRFSPPGAPVEVRSRCEGGEWVLSVQDHGRGIAPEELQRIDAFVQFQRKTYEQQGAGLGLIIARRLVERHGGALTIHSEPGAGTSVTVRLPRAALECP